MLGNRWFTIGIREESPGSVEQQQLLTTTKGDLRESATETKPPILIGKGEKSGVRAHSDTW